MNKNVLRTNRGFIIAISAPYHKTLYYSGTRKGKPQFTLDYLYARAFKTERAAQLKSYEF